MAALERVAGLLAGVRDILEHRVDSPDPPSWVQRRGWEGFLLGLGEADLARAEARGLGAIDMAEAPPELRALTDEARSLTKPFEGDARSRRALESEHVPLRKRSQVAALIDELRGGGGEIHRIVDMGAGHGHFARAAHAVLGLDVVGLDRDGGRIHVARDLAGDGVRFVLGSADAVELGERDLVVGLHACGALGDALLHRARDAGCPLLLVSCCLQKIDAPARDPLSLAGRTLGLVFPRPLLGLSNLSWGSAAAGAMRGREVRHALRVLLRHRGVEESEGSVAHGIHRRRFRRGLAAVAQPALERRGLAPAPPDEIEEHERLGAAEFARIRRLALPRNLLGRVLELAIVLDRARFLEERSYSVRVAPMFHTDVSPRNLGIVAKPPR